MNNIREPWYVLYGPPDADGQRPFHTGPFRTEEEAKASLKALIEDPATAAVIRSDHYALQQVYDSWPES